MQVSSLLIALLLTCILNFVSTKSLRRQDNLEGSRDSVLNSVGQTVESQSVRDSLLKDVSNQQSIVGRTQSITNPTIIYPIYHVGIGQVSETSKGTSIDNTFSGGVAQGAQTVKGMSLDNTFSEGVGQVSETSKGTSIDNTFSGGVAQGAQTAQGMSLDKTISRGVAQGVAQSNYRIMLKILALFNWDMVIFCSSEEGGDNAGSYELVKNLEIQIN
ncbi:hypothetical protein ABPG74_015663 [Tetrahymena malaccensis]